MLSRPVKFLVLLSLFSFLYGTERTYSLSIWGIPCGQVTMTRDVPDTVRFKTVSTGLIELIWSFDNTYTTVFDTADFSLRSYSKDIDQRNIRQTLRLSRESDLRSYVYDTGDIIAAPDSSLNIFTALLMAGSSRPEEIDTRRYSILMEGDLFQIRFVWIGPDTLDLRGRSLSTDHYRIDFLEKENERKILDQTDFFHEYLVHPQAVKQLWVTSEGDQYIAQAAVTLGGITIYGRVNQ